MAMAAEASSTMRSAMVAMPVVTLPSDDLLGGPSIRVLEVHAPAEGLELILGV